VISVCCGRVIFLHFGEAFIQLHDERVLKYVCVNTIRIHIL